MTPDGDYAVVDTDVVSYLLSGRAIAAPFRAVLSEHVPCISFVTIGELLKGALMARWSSRRTAAMMRHVRSDYIALPCNDAVAEEWAQLCAACRTAPPGVNDAWIAATAVAFDCPVIANDHGFRTMAERYPRLVVLP